MSGGRGGIRTLEAVLPPTRFPVARTRPGYATLPAAERVGFEPTEARHLTAFRERHLKPLGHLSTRKYTNQAPRTAQRQENRPAARAVDRWYAWQESNLRPLGPQPN